MYVAVVLNINFEFLLVKASAQINSGIWILPHIVIYSKWPQDSQKWEKFKKKWRGVSRTLRSTQKCDKKGTLDQNCECQIFYQNFFPTRQVTSRLQGLAISVKCKSYTYFLSQNKFSLQTQSSLMTAQKPRKCALSLALLPYALSPLREVAAAAAWQWRQHSGRGGGSAATVAVAAAWRWWLWQQLGNVGGSLAAAWRVA